MRQSTLIFHTRKEAPKDEVAVNAQLLIRAGFIDKLMAGVYTYLPLGLLVLKKIETIIRTEMRAIGGQEILMPVLHPKALWEKTGRWSTLESLFKFKGLNSEIEFALGPTHEEVITPLVQGENLSYKDLPVYLFQIQDKFRDEVRAKSGLLRGREFIMKDLYSFHATEEDLNTYYEKVRGAYETIFKKAGIGDMTYFTFASGGTFSTYSHEFQTLSESGEDTIYVCESCRVAVNREIIAEQRACPECGSEDLKERNAIEVGNIFKLKTKYSSAFRLGYKDKDGSEKMVVMGCYGIGLSRLMGTVVEVSHDEDGIIWPLSLAPASLHLLSIGAESEGLKKTAERVYNGLVKEGIETLFDDRMDVSAGEKFSDSDLIGIPYRIVVSEKLLKEGNVEVRDRKTKTVEIVKEADLVPFLKKTFLSS